MTETTRAFPSFVARDRDERLNSIDALKARHAEWCTGCYTCKGSAGGFTKPERPAVEMTLESHIAEPSSRGTGHRAEPVDVDGAVEAGVFLESYTGSWAFMLQLQSELRLGKLRFTPRVVEVILNCKAREEQWAQERSAKMVEALAAPVQAIAPREESRKWYAVDNDEGTLTFLRITTVKSGWTFIDQVIGGNPEAPRGRITPDGQYRGTFQSLYERVMQDPEAAMLRYGREIGRCGHCGRHLTDAASRAAGIGPVCAGKEG